MFRTPRRQLLLLLATLLRCPWKLGELLKPKLPRRRWRITLTRNHMPTTEVYSQFTKASIGRPYQLENCEIKLPTLPQSSEL